MVDWKKIRDEERKLDDAYMAFGEADYGERFGSSIEEGVAEEQRDEYRSVNFPSLISALEEQEKRIEFLEKALKQAVTLGNISLKPMRTIHKDKTETESVNVDISIQIQGRTVRAWVGDKELPELAAYLEEKNG